MFAPRNSSPTQLYMGDEIAAYQIKLKKVLGLTVCSNAALDVSPTTGILAYPAGCTVVLFNSKRLSQSYLLNTSRKAITAIAYSQCGRYIATGECGQNPAIKVWELDTATTTMTNATTNGSNISNGSHSTNGNGGGGGGGASGTVIAEFLGHKYAVSCIAFSPNGKYLVSVGSQHDMIVNVFDWKLNLKIASNKVSAKVVAVCFSQDGNYFVTVGNRHVKYWYLEGSRKYKEPIPLMGRSAILGELRNNDFCAVACGKGEVADSTYAITRSGQLVEFNARRLLDKWVACRTTLANCLCISSKYILVGCAESIIRVFSAETLEYLTTLPRTHYLGTDVAQGIHINHITQIPPNSKFPDTIAMVFDEPRMKVSCVYNDHSLYIWDLRDIRRVGKSHSFLYHSACIWGVESVPYNFINQLTSGGGSGEQQTNNLPLNCFLTCSSDDTIRFWGLDDCGDTNELFRKNIYSKELLKVLYIDDELNFIKDVDNPILNMEKPSSYDGRNGVRCIKISPDRQHLATGDRSGNIRIYNLSNLKLLTTIEAHDSEVLCLEYTNERIERKMLASASRDRLIHIFDVQNGYKILQTLDDHSSSITSVKFIGAGAIFQMVSCGADKSIIFRTFQNQQFLRGNNCSGKNTLYDMEIDSNSKHILTACQDRNIRIYGTQNAKHTKTFKGSHSDEGSLIKLSLDLSGIYIATSCTDKTLSVYDYYSTECMARMYGHSELVTGLKFTNDCKHLISASGDGCIFIWQVPHDMIVTMQARLSQQALRSGHISSAIQRPLSQIDPSTASASGMVEQFGSPPNFLMDDNIPVASGYKFSDVGQLPQWAKKKVDEQPPIVAPPTSAAASDNSGIILGSSPNQSQLIGINAKPRGRWAQKNAFERDVLELRNSPISDIVLNNNPRNNNNNQTSDYSSASSKDVYNNTYLSEDSSIDSGMENRRELFLSKTDKKALDNMNFESTTEHDGDIEDISDGERTSSDHGMMFYPTTTAPGTPTDFKVNAMNEDELRKSVRRQKFERQGLTLATPAATTIIAAAAASSAGTGTGTSDDEDEGSTPSGDNAERSLASTLGGSSESIPQQNSSSFLQAALDGPGSLSDRGDRIRRSISAKHNTDSGSKTTVVGGVTGAAAPTTSYSKSFSNTKKEELMKVINEAKQKLENVGYRSNLRSSQSISDLSHTANLERLSKIQRSSDDKGNYHHHNSNNNGTFLNCAAPKSVLTQNCNFIRQLQRDYPPYPYDIGVYPPSLSISPHHHPQMPIINDQSSKLRPNTLELPNLSVSTAHHNIGLSATTTLKGQKHPSILKNYKSCPVSPVHEELDWSNLPANSNNIIIEPVPAPRLSAHSSAFAANQPKRHSMYSDDAKTILDMIHLDTEKMIAEITQKYGDNIDDYDPIKKTKEKKLFLPKSSSACDLKPMSGRLITGSGFVEKEKSSPQPQQINPKMEHKEHGFLSDEDGNFSSDSLEDCSLDLDLNLSQRAATKRRLTKDTVCHKHSKIKHQNDYQQLPKRSISDYFIYDQSGYLNRNRNVSLSDILNDDNGDGDNKENYQFLDTQRHSSASFFLGPNPDRKSQESLLSDEISGGNGSYCNSMESILSDDSECKSAPLEALFIRSVGGKFGGNNHRTPFIDAATTSKSYGSSPNATIGGFDYYMQQHHHHQQSNKAFEVLSTSQANYYDNYMDNRIIETHTSKMIPSSSLVTGTTYPWITQTIHKSTTDEFIPRIAQSKNVMVSKSLSKEFANQRQTNNSNPIFDTTTTTITTPTTITSTSTTMNPNQKPIPPIKPPQLLPIKHRDIFTDPTVYVMKKSCSFDIDMFDGRRMHRSTKKYEQNLEKFEKERKMSVQFGGTLEMDYVPHKPPVANRRSSSMKNKRNSRDKERYHTVGQINCSGTEAAAQQQEQHHEQEYHQPKQVDCVEEKSFEIYVAEKGATEDGGDMDSLEFYSKPKQLHNSVDSLDDINHQKRKLYDNDADETGDNGDDGDDDLLESTSIVSSNFLTQAEYLKFRDIEKKIDVINKLVELEERKLEQERIIKENRLKPFQCDTKQKGYVKSLTMNFDNLAKTTVDYGSGSGGGIAGSGDYEKQFEQFKMKRNFSLPDVLEGAKFQAFEFSCDINTDFNNDPDNYHNLSDNHGNPKSLMSAQIDDSSSIRRACSLSDLSMGKGFKSMSNNQSSLLSSSSSGYKPIPSNRQSAPARSLPKRSGSSVGGIGGSSKPILSSQSSSSSSTGMGVRSISVGTLNQASDSDPEALLANRGGVLRPTISSQNKTNGSSTPQNNNNRPHTNSKNAAGLISRRRGLTSAYSSVNLSTTGQDDSSSEEAQSTSSHHPHPHHHHNSHQQHMPNNGKPAIPPRPRSISVDHKRNGGIPGMIGNIIGGGGGGGGGGGVVGGVSSGSGSVPSIIQKTKSNNFEDIPCKDNDVNSSDLTAQLCSNIIQELMATTNSVMQLHQRLKHSDESSGARHKNLMLKELENAVIMTQSMLTKVTNNRTTNDNNSPGSNNSQLNFLTNDNNRSTNNNTNSGNSTIQQNGNVGSGDYSQMMDKCSDMLHKVQKQVHNT